ncbi:MAG: lactate utilization protein [Halobacteriota archaeon]
MVEPTPFSAINLLPEVNVDSERWNRLPSDEEVARAVAAIRQRGINVIQARNAQKALETLRAIVPAHAEVMSGSSTTLIEIGYDAFIKSGQSSWTDLHDVITAEDETEKRYELRRKSVAADYFISGVNAIAQSGEIVACDKTGSRVGAWPFAAKHLILVSGVNKIVPTLNDALKRVWEYAFPLENARVKKASNGSSQVGKCVILANEASEGRTILVLVDEALGY